MRRKDSYDSPERIAKGNSFPRRYTSILADDYHDKIRDLAHLRRIWGPRLGLFCNGILVGRGELCRMSRKAHLHTDATRIFNEYRKQGHGIKLYLSLIQHARRLGATRIYSGTILNKFSTRMWKVKLAKLYNVKRAKTKGGCLHCGRDIRYYIDL